MARWILDREPEGGTPSAGLRRLMADDADGIEARRERVLVARAGEVGATGVAVGDGPRSEVAGAGRTAPAAGGYDRGGDRTAGLTIVGVAGASGKSAVAAFLRGISRAEGRIVGSVGPASWFDGDSIRPLAPGAAGPAGFAAMLDGMTHQGCDSAILEVGRAALDRRDLDGLALTAAVVTELGDSDRAGRRRSCARLIRRVEAGGAVVIDADDPEADVLGAVNLGARRVTFGIDEGAAVEAEAHPRVNVSAVVDRVDAGSCRFRLRGFDREVAVTLRVGGGRATIRQALAAAAVAWSFGVPADTVVRGLESVARVPGRFEPIRAGQPFEVRVDRAGQAGDLTRALAHLRALVPGRVACVVGAEAASLGEPTSHLKGAERAAIGRAAELGADRVILTVGDPRDEDPNGIVDELLAGMIHPGRARVELDRRAAIALALAEAGPGDGVLIVGQAVPFDAAAVADQLLRAAHPADRASA